MLQVGRLFRLEYYLKNANEYSLDQLTQVKVMGIYRKRFPHNCFFIHLINVNRACVAIQLEHSQSSLGGVGSKLHDKNENIVLF